MTVATAVERLYPLPFLGGALAEREKRRVSLVSRMWWGCKASRGGFLRRYGVEIRCQGSPTLPRLSRDGSREEYGLPARVETAAARTPLPCVVGGGTVAKALVGGRNNGRNGCSGGVTGVDGLGLRHSLGRPLPYRGSAGLAAYLDGTCVSKLSAEGSGNKHWDFVGVAVGMDCKSWDGKWQEC